MTPDQITTMFGLIAETQPRGEVPTIDRTVYLAILEDIELTVAVAALQQCRRDHAWVTPKTLADTLAGADGSMDWGAAWRIVRGAWSTTEVDPETRLRVFDDPIINQAAADLPFRQAMQGSSEEDAKWAFKRAWDAVQDGRGVQAHAAVLDIGSHVADPDDTAELDAAEAAKAARAHLARVGADHARRTFPDGQAESGPPVRGGATPQPLDPAVLAELTAAKEQRNA